MWAHNGMVLTKKWARNSRLDFFLGHIALLAQSWQFSTRKIRKQNCFDTKKCRQSILRENDSFDDNDNHALHSYFPWVMAGQFCKFYLILTCDAFIAKHLPRTVGSPFRGFFNVTSFLSSLSFPSLSRPTVHREIAPEFFVPSNSWTSWTKYKLSLLESYLPKLRFCSPLTQGLPFLTIVLSFEREASNAQMSRLNPDARIFSVMLTIGSFPKMSLYEKKMYWIYCLLNRDSLPVKQWIIYIFVCFIAL